MHSDAYFRGKITGELLNALQKARKATEQITQAKDKTFHAPTEELLATIENVFSALDDSLIHAISAEDLIHELELQTRGVTTPQNEKKKPPEQEASNAK